jgi:periplasmic divalent cation tolerance protein
MRVKRFIVVMVMCGSRPEARKIVRALLEKRLIACGNIIAGVESRFRWQGKLEYAREYLALLKARGPDFAAIEKEIRRLHSYEVPEIIALPVPGGSRAYLDWLDESVKRKSGKAKSP